MRTLGALAALALSTRILCAQDLDLSQIPPGTDVFSTMTEGNNTVNDVFNIPPPDDSDPNSWIWTTPGPRGAGKSRTGRNP